MIYLDYQATTPLAPEALAAMRPWLETKYANPHSPHRPGREAAAAVEVARERVVEALAKLPDRPSRAKSRDARTEVRASTSLGMDGSGDGMEFGEGTDPTPNRPSRAKSRDPRTFEHPQTPDPPQSRAPGRLLFTSGATEAANLAIKGAAWAAPPERTRIVTLATEHACVLDTVRWLGGRGFEAVVLPVGADGLVDPDRVRDAVDDRTLLVAAMLVNNEIGVIQPVAEIAAIARGAGALFLCDAVQGLGRVAVHDADLIAVSAHKIHGPKGVGALWVRDGVTLEPLMHGGGQEGGIRSGTLSPALCAGFGAAAHVAAERMAADRDHVEALWDRAVARLGGDWTINGAADARWRGNLNIRRDGLDAARLISELRDIAFSAGSACASGSGRPSHVLKALGLSDREARSSIRLGFGRYTTAEALDAALDRLVAAAAEQGLVTA